MSDFIKSDFCTECEGVGHVEEEQCAECEYLHDLERKADIKQDIAKGN